MSAPTRSIALLNPCFWPEVRRGGERLVHELGTGLVADGHRVRLLTSHPGRPTTTVEDGITIHRAWRPPDRLLRRRAVQPYVTHLPFTRRALRTGDDDLAHAFYYTDGAIAARWGRETGRPVVLTWAGLADRRALAAYWHGLRLIQEATSGADAVITLTRAARDALWRWLRVESEIIAPGVDLDRFTPGAERADVPTFLCPAALDDPRKRGPLLLAAFERVRERVPHARLVLQRPADPSAAAELGREAGVVLADLDADEALRTAYRRAWCTVLPSRAEAFGLVVAESLACGTPGVARDDGGTAEILDGDERIGLTFGGDDPRALATAMERALPLVEDAGTADACRRRAAVFSQDRCVAEHEALYERLLALRHAPGARR